MNIRKLGYTESLYYYAHKNCHGAGLMMCVLPYTGKIDPIILSRSLEMIYNQHPNLRSRIVEKIDGLYLEESVFFKSIPVEIKHNVNWQSVVSTISDQQIPTEHYLWKLIIIVNDSQQSCLILLIHHAIADGVSVMNALFDLLITYENITLGYDITPIDQSPSASYHLESQLHNTMTMKEKLKLSPAINQTKQINPIQWDYEENIPIENRSSHTIFSSLNQDETKKLMESCRKNKVTVTSALTAAALLAIAKIKKETINVVMGTSISMRDHCEPKIPSSVMGCYISFTNTLHSTINECGDLWTIAQNYQEQLREKIKKDLHFVNIDNLLLKEIEAHFETELQMPGSYFMGGMDISNLGKTSFKSSYANIEVEGVYFSMNRRLGNFVMLIAVATFNNRMCFSCNYAFPNITDHTADRYVRLFLNELILVQ